jgi:hypothetical protein
MTIRFRADRLAGKDSSYSDNGYYLLVNPNSSTDEKLYTLKAPGKNWSSSVTTTITLSKTYTSSTFTVPAYWICNTGSVTPDLAARTATYVASGTMSMYNLFKSDSNHRKSYATRIGSKTVTGIKAAAGSSPSVSIVDNGNNTFTISGKLGTNGTNNPIKAAEVWYTTDGTSDPSVSANSTRFSISCTATSGSSFSKQNVSISAKSTVKVYVKCTFTYGSATTTAATNAIKYYKEPSKPGTPVLSYTKSRLTVKEPWTFTWPAATAANTDSPVVGYLIMLLKKSVGESSFSFVREISARNNNHIIRNPGSNSNNSTNYFIKRPSTSCTVILNDPKSFGFVAGDQVRLRVKSYTLNGADPQATLQGDSNNYTDSANYTVQNAGIVNVKVGNQWKEGQVYVKVGKAWREAETVYTKTAAGWKESQ